MSLEVATKKTSDSWSLSQLSQFGQLVLQNDEQLFQFDRNLNHQRQFENERAVLFTSNDMSSECLDDLRRAEEPMKVFQDKQGRPVL